MEQQDPDQSEQGWTVPDTWSFMPVDEARRSKWAIDQAESSCGTEPQAQASLLVALQQAVSAFSVDQDVQPFVVLDSAPPWLAATGWVRILRWDAEPARESIQASFEEQLQDAQGLQKFEILEADLEGLGPSACLVLHTVEVADEPGDLEERVTAYLIDPRTSLVRQLCIVTTDLAAFDDMPGLAAEVLERSLVGDAS